MNIEMEKQDDFNRSTMMERGKFVANNHEFTVIPLFLMEEDEYMSDVIYLPIPPSIDKTDKEINDVADKDLAMFLLHYSKQPDWNKSSHYINTQEKQSKIPIFAQKILNKFSEKYHKLHYYDNNASLLALDKWIRIKISCNNKPTCLYDLERKYLLSKAEIVRLLVEFNRLSNFI